MSDPVFFILCALLFPLVLWNADRRLPLDVRRRLNNSLTGQPGAVPISWAEAFLYYFDSYFGAARPWLSRFGRALLVSTLVFAALALISWLTALTSPVAFVYMLLVWLTLGVAIAWPRDIALLALTGRTVRTIDNLNRVAWINRSSGGGRFVGFLITWILPAILFLLLALMFTLVTAILARGVQVGMTMAGFDERIVEAKDYLQTTIGQPQAVYGTRFGAEEAYTAILYVPLAMAGFVLLFALGWSLSRVVVPFVARRRASRGEATEPRPLRLVGLLAPPLSLAAIAGTSALFTLAIAGLAMIASFLGLQMPA